MSPVDEFLAGLIPLLRLHRHEDQVRNRQHAFRFRAFDYFRPQENTLSRILSDLLDPRGSHGSGKAILDSFLKIIGHPELTEVSARAAVRYQDTSCWVAGGGIPDITVDLQGYIVCIENKPFACDQPEQLERYRRSMEQRCRQSFCLVYLSGNAGEPTSIAKQTRLDLEKAGRFRAISYGTELMQWLEDCRDSSEAPKICGFLNEFIDYVKFTFQEGGLMSGERNVIIQAAFQNSERLDAALLIGSVYEDIKLKLVKRRFEDVQSRLESGLGAGWEFKIGDHGGPGAWYLSFGKAAWPASIYLGFGRDSVQEDLYLFAGRWNGPSQRMPIDATLKKALDSGVRIGRKETAYCCWWQYLNKYTKWDAIDTLKELALSSEPVEYVVTLLSQIREVAEPLLDNEVRRCSVPRES